jgi:23S rRNA-/tRNA-specific pseudouridylate synthase
VFVEGDFPDVCRAEGYMVPNAESVVRRHRRFIRAEDAPPVHALPADADAAVTEFTRIATDGIISHLTARLETGRQHQIRATLLELGYPIVGDKLYGVDPALFLRCCNSTLTESNHRALRIERQALHACFLGFIHPADHQLLEFIAPLPADLEVLACRIKSQVGVGLTS